MPQMALKENVVVEEENLQDYQKRRKQEKLRQWKEKALHGEFAQQMWPKRSPGDGSRMGF